MASTRVDWLRRLVEMWNTGDLNGFLDAIGPEFTFTPDPSFPDAGTYSGEDLRRWMGEWAGTWEASRLEILGITEMGNAAIVASRWHLTAAGGDSVPVQDFSFVTWFDGNRPVRAAAFFDDARARQAAEDRPG